jgi:adenosylmethionine-8-amino-7-oxononanoate aminotransferase
MDGKKPTVFMRNLHATPKKIVKGEGCYLWDDSGKQYLDAASGVAVASIGHGVKEVAEAMMKQAMTVNFVHGGRVTVGVRDELAGRLIALAPEGMDHVFFCCGGSEATESALKMARQYHVERGNLGKYKVVARWRSYHGNTVGALAMSGRPSWRNLYTPYILDFPHVSPATCYRCPFDREYPECGVKCAWDLERVIKHEGEENISAFIAEPIIGTTATACAPPKEYYSIIRDICDKYDVLMIMDEVITGIGRTGKNFGIDHYDVTPDIIAAAKGMSGGYAPIGAVIAHNDVFDTFYNGSGLFHHSFTFSGNPISCAAANAVLKYIADHRLIERSAVIGAKLLDALKERFQDHPAVGDIRGTGLLLGMEFVKDKATKEPYPADVKFSDKLAANAFNKGLLVVGGVRGTVDSVVGDHIQITPPYVLTEAQIEELVDKLDMALQETMDELRTGMKADSCGGGK